MSSETHTKEENNVEATANVSTLLSSSFDINRSTELDKRIRNDFISYCYSFLQENEEDERSFIESVWNKYLQSVGDISFVNIFDKFLL